MPAHLSYRLAATARIALYGGILLPVLETIRRRNELVDPAKFLYWFDDYLIGGFLVFGAIKVLRSGKEGKSFLSGAWGFATGMGFASLVSQLDHLGVQDPSQINSGVVAVVKGIMLLLSVVCLCITMREEVH